MTNCYQLWPVMTSLWPHIWPQITSYFDYVEVTSFYPLSQVLTSYNQIGLMYDWLGPVIHIYNSLSSLMATTFDKTIPNYDLTLPANTSHYYLWLSMTNFDYVKPFITLTRTLARILARTCYTSPLSSESCNFLNLISLLKVNANSNTLNINLNGCFRWNREFY